MENDMARHGVVLTFQSIFLSLKHCWTNDVDPCAAAQWVTPALKRYEAVISGKAHSS